MNFFKFLSVFLLSLNLYSAQLNIENSIKSIDEGNFTVLQNIFDISNSTKDSKTIFSLIDKIVALNSNIEVLQKEFLDLNLTTVNSQVENLNIQKSRLLALIPFYLVKDVDEMQSKVGILTSINSKFQGLLKEQLDKENFEYILKSSSFEILKTNLSFYQFLLKVTKNYLEGFSESSLDELLKDEVSYIQSQNLIYDIKNYPNFDDSQNQNIEQIMLKGRVLVKSYKEILVYLVQNSNLLEGNIIIREFKFDSIINYINSHINFKNSYVNMGKIIVSALIFVLFIFLQYFLYKIVYFFLVKTIGSNIDQDKISKSDIIRVIKNPIRVLLMVLVIDLWVSIGFYPAPSPIIIAQVLSIVYAVFIYWFIIAAIDVYGIIILSKIAKISGKRDIVNLTVKLLKIIIFLIILVLLLREFNFNVTALITSLGVTGLVIAFATKDIIANFFSSIILVFDNSISQGDWIVIGNMEGTVVEIGLRKTIVRGFDNSLMFIPNLNIVTTNIKNWTRRKVGRRIEFKIGVPYNTPKDLIQKCIDEIRQMLLDNPKIAKPVDWNKNYSNIMTYYEKEMVSIDDLTGYKSNLFVNLNEFSDSSISIFIYCFSQSIVWGDWLKTQEEVMFNIMDIFQNNGVEFAFPSQSLYLESIPSEVQKIIAIKKANQDLK